MIDDEADFDNILDVSEEVQTAIKFRPKQCVKPRKTTLSSRSAALSASVETRDGKGALTQVHSSKELISHGRVSLLCPGSEKVDNNAGSQGILDTASENVLIVPLGSLDNCGVACDSATGDASAIDRVSQDEDHNGDSSKFAKHQESLVASNIHVSPASSCGKTIDDIVEFGEMFDTHTKEERVAKFQPKVKVKRLNAAAKSGKTNQKVEASTSDVVTQNVRGENIQKKLHGDLVEATKCHESEQTSDSKGLLAADNSTDGNLGSFDSVLEESVHEETIVKIHPKFLPKPWKASCKATGTNDYVAAATPMVGVCAENNDMRSVPKDQEVITNPATCSPEDVQATVDLDYQNDLTNPPVDGTRHMVAEVSDGPTFKSQPNVGREKGRGKSVSFALPDASEGLTPTDTSSEMGNFNHPCNDKLTDENLSNSSQQAVGKHCVCEEQHSNDQECIDNQHPYHEGEPLVSELPMKLRNRKKLLKVGTPKDTADDYFDEDCAEPTLVEGDNDSGDNYTAGAKGKVRKKSKDGVEKVLKDKDQVPTRGRKRIMTDAFADKPEKKLTHRIRQRRTKGLEVKTLLETPREEIDPMKLSAAHLRLLQEARERVNTKEISSGPSSNTRSFQLEDTDDLDFRDEEARNFDDDRAENHMQNAKKLNYHSYMNKQIRAKWSKSDTDLFYQALRQFGSDFAMIQQLFPDKTRHQVRQKFKAEEKRNPLLIHDAIIHRAGDNLYFKKVIKQLNIENVLPAVDSTGKQDSAPNERGHRNEIALDDFNNEENGSDWLDDEHNMHMSHVQEENHVSGNDNADILGGDFDWE